MRISMWKFVKCNWSLFKKGVKMCAYVMHTKIKIETFPALAVCPTMDLWYILKKKIAKLYLQIDTFLILLFSLKNMSTLAVLIWQFIR